MKFNVDGTYQLYKSAVRYPVSPQTYSDSLGNLVAYFRNNRFLTANFQAAMLNSAHQVVSGSAGINLAVNSANHAKLVPHNGKLYLFTLNLATLNVSSNLYYTVVDMSQNNGSGGTVSKNNFMSQLPAQISIEAVRHANGNDWWIMYHGHNSNTIYVYLLDSNGVQFHSTQDLGITLGGFCHYAFTFAHWSGEKVVFTDKSRRIKLCNFDRCTGIFSNPTDLSLYPLNFVFSSNNAMPVTIFSLSDSIMYPVLFDTVFQVVYDQQGIKRKHVLWLDSTQLPLFGSYVIRYNIISNKSYVGFLRSQNYWPVPHPLNTKLSVIDYPDREYPACNYRHAAIDLGRVTYGSLPADVNYGLGPLGKAYALRLRELPTTICEDSLLLGGGFTEQGLSYQWAPATGLSCTTCANPRAKPAQTTTYTLYTTNSRPCGIPSDSATVTVYVVPPATPVANVGADAVLCPGVPVTVGSPAVPGYSYLWLPDSLTTPQITVNPTQTTVYTLAVRDTAAGCSYTALDSVRVTVAEDAVVSVSIRDTTICGGSTLTLVPKFQVGGKAFNVLWSTGDTTTTLTVSPIQTTSYTVTVSGSICVPPAADTVTVTVVPAVAVSAAAGTVQSVVCAGDSAVLVARGDSGLTFGWEPGNLTGREVVVRPSASTVYTLTASSGAPCSVAARDTVLSPSDSLCSPTSRGGAVVGSQFILHPNPTQGQLTVRRSWSGLSRVELEITTPRGQVLVRGTLRPTDRETVLNLESLAAGVYLCRFIQNGQTLETHKLVLTR
jgi:hypothetical protein